MRLRNVDLNLISAMLLFIALVMRYVYSDNTVIPLILIVASLALTITYFVRRNQSDEEPESDERTRINGAYGLTYSWMIGVSGIVCLFWAEYFGIWRPGTLIALGISLLIFLLTAVVFLAYLSNKGGGNV